MKTRRDAGFTLIELLIAVVLSSLIAGVTVAALMTSLNVASSTTDQVNDSTDAGLISAFLFRDAQSAGATNPVNAQLDPTLGVSTANDATGWSGCAQTGTLVVRFSWADHTSVAAQSTAVATYALDTSKQLVRRLCKNGTTVDVILGRFVNAATATCTPGPTCSGHPASVALDMTGSGVRAPFRYTLTAALRSDVQTPPQTSNSSPVPLVALGNATAPCPNLTLGGTGAVTVVGDALVDATCGAAPISGNASTLQPTGATSSIAGIVDPFNGRTAPAATCPASGVNPAPIGASPSPTAVVVYPQAVTISSAVVFQPGQYVFCQGLSLAAGAAVTGAGVLLYVAAGAVSVNAAARVDLAASTTGTFANLLLWVSSPAAVTIADGPHANSYRGIVYAPSSAVQLSSAVAMNVGGLIAQTANFSGAGSMRLGMPVPVIAMSPPTIPNAEVGVSYAANVTASGGTTPLRFTASGLPAGLTINAASGVISGTPTTTGSSSVIVTVFDATAAAASMDYTIAVSPKLTITGPATLQSGEVGLAYTSTAITSTGGATPISWSATGLPAGLTIDPVSGVISGTPGAAGSSSVVVYAADPLGANPTMSYTVTILPAVAITAPASLPSGQAGVAYTPTTFTASGGASPVSWSATGLPKGLTIAAGTGVVSGTPLAAGPFSVVVTVTDAIGATATKTLPLTIAPPSQALVISGPATLPAGQVGVAYTSTTVTASGGLAPYAWTATNLPAGLAIDPASGAITGTPTTAGTKTATVTVTDSLGTTAPMSYSLTVNPVVVVPPGCPSTITGWQGQYYSNATLSGASTLCRDDAAINFDWGSGSPAPSLPSDNFSVRWTRTQTFTADDYTFSVGSDDGARLYIDGALVLDRWVDQGYPSPPPTVVKTLTAGSHTIVMEYYEHGGLAQATLTWAGTPPLPPACSVAASNWFGQYYSNVFLTGNPTMCRDDAAINFNWGSGSADPIMPADNFSVRWTRTINFAADTYTFTLGSDDGARLYIDGVLVLDRWVDQSYPTPQPTVTQALTAGNHTIVVEYYERGGLAQATLTWAGTPPTPPSCLVAASGWFGQYYSNVSLTGQPTLCQDDPAVNFDWGTGAPAAGMPVDNFSVRWTKTLVFTAGAHTFTLGTDDGGRLYIDGALVLDRWVDQSFPSPQPSVTQTLSAGNHTIVVEYYERGGYARALLNMS